MTVSMPITSTAEALIALNVQELASTDRESLDRDGLLLIPDVLTAEQVANLRKRVDDLERREGTRAGSEIESYQDPAHGAAVLIADLVSKDPAFEVCLIDRRVLAAVSHVVRGDLKLFAINVRSPGFGAGHQPLHTDWPNPVPDGQYEICNSVWMLDDFTADNGATRVVPGSHRRGALPGDEMPDPNNSHPDEILMTGKAGTVAVFNSHLWHGGTINTSGAPRRAVFCAYSHRDCRPQYEFAAQRDSAVLEKLHPASRYLMGLE